MKTLVVGASEKPHRYSYKAITLLQDYKHEVIALSNKPGRIDSLEFETEKKPFEAIDTVTLYINSNIQKDYYDYIIRLKPRRVIFNPGTENLAFQNSLNEHGIRSEEACTLVLLNTGQY